MKTIRLTWGFFSLLLSYDAQACVADAECIGGQVCCKCENTEKAWECGGNCIIPNGGYCCVNPGCIKGCSVSSTKDLKEGEPSNDKDQLVMPK